MALGCGAESPVDDSVPATIRVVVTPNQPSESLRERHGALIRYLEQATGISYELIIPADYEDLQQKFASGDADMAWLGGLTYVQAEMAGYADPLVLRDIDIQFTSCYVVNASSESSGVDQFRGGRFSFGPELSTSGHLMPRYFLTRQGYVPEEFFGSVRYSEGHYQTAEWVADGAVDLGVANCIILQSLFASGRLDREEVRILDATQPYSDYVWVARTSMDEATRAIILDAFLALDATRPEHLEVLRRQGANAYLPAGSSDFDLVRAAALEAGLLREEAAQ